jgi:hypothetical protein
MTMTSERILKREFKTKAALGAIAVVAGLNAAKTAAKIVNPLDPLGPPKLLPRLAKLGVYTAVAGAAAFVACNLERKRDACDRVRNVFRPDKG